MGNAFIKESTLTAIGNAIRAKTGGTDLMLPSAMAVAIEGMELGGKSGSYVWTKQGMGESLTVDESGGTYTLTTPNDTRPSTEIEYSSAAPTYDETKRRWIFAESTVVTVANSDATLPSISGNVYVRVTSEPNIWYLVSAFAKGSSSPYLKSMTYSQKITAPIDWAKKYLTDIDGDKYPDSAWLDGYYYTRTVADPNSKDAGELWLTTNTTSGDFYSVYYANGIWVAGGKSGLYYSTDGKTWTQSNVTSGNFGSLCYANGLWVAGSNNNGGGLYYSTDGKTWTRSNVTSGNFNTVYYNGIWVAGSNSNKGLYVSSNGKTWTQSNITNVNIYSIYKDNGIWVAGGDYNKGLLYSTDGNTWTQSNVTNITFYSLFYANGLWVAGGKSGLYYSTDGKTWTQSNVTSGNFGSLCYANGLWVATNGTNPLVSDYDGIVYYSTDGKTWTRSNLSGVFYSLFYANGLWVAGGKSGLYYSTDGKTWTQSNVTSGNFNSVYYANGIWVAGSNSGLWYSKSETVEVDF